jgi:predicted ATPase
MRAWLERALRGERQVVFVTGEPGIGKTTVVNAVLDEAVGMPGILVCRGQCLEHYGAGEAYLPLFDGLLRLGRTPHGPRIVELLRQHAPAWLLELPSLLPPAGGRRSSGKGRARPATRYCARWRGRGAIAAESPLIVVLEDLHWSDYSTLDLIHYLARRRDPARLMVIGACGPSTSSSKSTR